MRGLLMCDEGGCEYASAATAAEPFPYDVFLTVLSNAASVKPFSRVRARTVADVVACAPPPPLFEDTIDGVFALFPNTTATGACLASFEPIPILGPSLLDNAKFPFGSTDG